MTKYYLAIDIGASSGRHMLCHMEEGRLVMEEIHRFKNGMDESKGHLVWDVERLFDEIIAGLKKAGERGTIPETIAIDTWAVDYVLVDDKGDKCAPVYGYRDGRTSGIEKEVYGIISEDELYGLTGIQHQSFNTVFQLMAALKREPDTLEKAAKMLMLPDYFNYRLTGVMKQEYTNATSTGLVNAKSGDWDDDMIKRLGYPRDLFLPIEMPGTAVGHLTPQIAALVGYDTTVMMAASHDTASAVMAVPASGEDVLYISSGTWSLMGIESTDPILSEAAREANFTNEGGYGRRFRFLKNIMGLWMIQQVRGELNDSYSFGELCDMARAEELPGIVDVNDECFLAPDNMQKAIRSYMEKKGLKTPENTGQMASVIYNSLAECYARTVGELQSLTGRKYDTVYIVGGGANADYLNELTAQKTGCRVSAGPSEATAIGNIVSQMIADGQFDDLAKARECVRDSFEIKQF